MFLVLRSAVPSWRGGVQRPNGIPAQEAQEARLKTACMHLCAQGCIQAEERCLHASILLMFAAQDTTRVIKKELSFFTSQGFFSLKVRDAGSREKQPSVQDASAALIRVCWCHLLEDVDICSEDFCPSMNTHANAQSPHHQPRFWRWVCMAKPRPLQHKCTFLPIVVPPGGLGVIYDFVQCTCLEANCP